MNKGLEKNSDTKKDSVTEVMKEVQLRLDSLAQGIVNTEINLTDEQRNTVERAALINGVITDLEENTIAECVSFITLKEVDNIDGVIYTGEINRIYGVRKINIYKWSKPYTTRDYVINAVINTLNAQKKGTISKERKANNIEANISQKYFEVLEITVVVVETESKITLKYQQVDIQELSEKIKSYTQAAQNSSRYPVISENTNNMIDEFVTMELKEIEWFDGWIKGGKDEQEQEQEQDNEESEGFDIGMYYGM